MKKLVLILLSLCLAQPLMAIEQASAQQQPKKTFWTKTKIALAAVGAIGTAAVVAFFGHKVFWQEKLPKGYDPNQSLNSNLLGAVYAAPYNERAVKDIQQLIKMGASPAIQDGAGKTPLITAVEQHSDPQIIKLLSVGEIKNRKIVNIEGANRVPLEVAVVNLFFESTAPNVELGYYDLEIIKILVDRNATINEPRLSELYDLLKGKVDNAYSISESTFGATAQKRKGIINEALQLLEVVRKRSESIKK